MYRIFGLFLVLGALLFFAPLNTTADDFAREGKPKQRALKDPLEGKAPPALQVTSWTNTDGKPIDLKQLTGKVVVLKFWGVW